jgi:predicted nucleic acid-binding protein
LRHGGPATGAPRSRCLAITAANPRGAVYGTIVATAVIAAAAGHASPGLIPAATVATLAVVSRLAWPEAVAALAAAHRGRRVSDQGYRTATHALRSCFERCTTVSITDAIHLATALAVIDTDPVLVTWDKRLRLAAAQAGLVAAPAAA